VTAATRTWPRARAVALSRGHWLSLIALANQLVVLVAQFLVARRFGVQCVVDAWMAAQVLPALAGAVLGALAGQLALPALVAARERGGGEQLHRSVTELLTLFGLGSAVLGGALALLAGPATGLVAPGLAAESRETAIGLLRILALGLMPAGATLVLSQAAQTQGRFVAVACLAPATGVVQLAAFLLAPPDRALHWMIAAQAGFAFLLLPICGALAGTWRRPCLARPSRVSRELLARSVPVVLILAATRVNLAVDTFFASSLEAGSLAALGYASRTVFIIQAVLAAPIASIVFVRLSRHAARDRWGDLARSARSATERGFFLSIAAVMVVAGLARPAAAMLLGQAESAVAVHTVAACLVALSGSLMCAVWGSVLVRVCLAARRDLFALLSLGVLPMISNVLLDAALVGRAGVGGLAAVTGLNAVGGLPIIDHLLCRRGVLCGPLYRPLLRFALAALPPGALLLAVPVWSGASFLAQFAGLAGLALVGLLGYVLLVQALGGNVPRLLRDE
jgi:putative peptidoglycan lipid II flippase